MPHLILQCEVPVLFLFQVNNCLFISTEIDAGIRAFCKCGQTQRQELSSVFLAGRATLRSSGSHTVLSFAFTLLWLIFASPETGWEEKSQGGGVLRSRPTEKQVGRTRVRRREKPWADDLDLSSGFGDQDLFPSVLTIFPWVYLPLFILG